MPALSHTPSASVAVARDLAKLALMAQMPDACVEYDHDAGFSLRMGTIRVNSYLRSIQVSRQFTSFARPRSFRMREDGTFNVAAILSAIEQARAAG